MIANNRVMKPLYCYPAYGPNDDQAAHNHLRRDITSTGSVPSMNTKNDAKPIISLREVTRDNLLEILTLNVAPSQTSFVASNAISISEAYFEEKAWFRGIYADDIPVGFLMTYEDPAQGFFYLWRYMIDADHQRKGYGHRAMRLLIERTKTMPNIAEIKLSAVDGAGSPIPFYEGIGFTDTGEIEDGERVFKLFL